MRDWNYSHSKVGFSVVITEGPWWSFIPMAITNLSFRFCDILPSFDLFPVGEDEKWSIHDVYHLYVCSPLCSWAGKVEDKYHRDYRLAIPVTDLGSLRVLDNNFRQFYDNCQYESDEDTSE